MDNCTEEKCKVCKWKDSCGNNQEKPPCYKDRNPYKDKETSPYTDEKYKDTSPYKDKDPSPGPVNPVAPMPCVPPYPFPNPWGTFPWPNPWSPDPWVNPMDPWKPYIYWTVPVTIITCGSYTDTTPKS